METLRLVDPAGATEARSGGQRADLGELAAGAIHCWHFDLDAPIYHGVELTRLLSDDEIDRGMRIGHPTSRKRFLTSKAFLRHILGHYLGIEPRSITLTKGPHGKPRLAGSDGLSGLVFNATDTGGRGALALACDGHLGIDLQAWRPLRDSAALLRRCWADSERAYWSQLEAPLRTAALFRSWTLKEAFCKAVGRGLALGPHRCVFDCDGPRPKLTACPPEWADCGNWDFIELSLPPGTSGAIALNRPIHTLREFSVGTQRDTECSSGPCEDRAKPTPFSRLR